MSIQEKLDLLIILTIKKDYNGIKNVLAANGYTSKFKGDLLELYIKELYEGNGWICNIIGGKGDKGADLLISHPQTPSKVEHILQSKNHSHPLNFKDTRSELIQFEEQASIEYKCRDYKLISLNGYVKSIKDRRKMNKLQKFNISLLDFEFIKSLINTYKPILERNNIKPTLSLYSHNELSYKRILEQWKESNRTCIIKATGLGKSKVILKVLGEHFYNKNKIILAPSNIILNQFKNDPDNWALNNSTYFTYQRLLTKIDSISNLNPEIIILDEFHRCGAEQWNKGIETLLKTYPNAKVLGTTATPIRSDSKDMSQQLFYGNIANTLSIHEAIINNKLPMPKYISSIYDLSEEIINLNDKVEKSNNTIEEKINLTKKLEKIHIDWKNSKGISEILNKHINNECSKGIVFCEDVNHLNNMYHVVGSWFNDAGFDVKSNKIYSEYPESKKEFIAFKEAKKGKVKNRINLLFSINMLNEGVHIKDVDFVIFLRKTTSEIIYLQQLGRILQTNKENTPIVFDLVCNFKNIKNSFINGFKDSIREIDTTQKELGIQGRVKTVTIEQINASISDECKNIKDIFKKIENILINTWEARYEELVAYFNENGHSNVPSNYEENRQLATWVSSQRYLYKKGELSKNKQELLAKVNFSYNPIEDYWNEMYCELVKYYKKNKHSNVPFRYEANNQLGLWVSTQRKAYKKNELSKEKQYLLSKVDFSYNPKEDSWNEMYYELVKYYKKNKHSNVTIGYEKNKQLALWVRTQRKVYKKNELSKEKQYLLSKVDFSYNPNEDYWNTMYNYLVEYFKENKHSNVPLSYEKNKQLALWVSNQRKLLKNNKMSKEKRQLLSKVNFSYNPKEDSWNEMYNELVKYYRKNKHSNVPNRYKENKALGFWVHRQRNSYKNNTLSKKRIKLLEEVNFNWNLK